MRRRFHVLALAALVTGCAGQRTAPPGSVRPASGYASCVPYARALSGIALRGDARTWWAAAAGQYRRDARPAPGSVLAFPAHGRMRGGHLSVVTRVVGPREIRVAHANWASGGAKGRIATDQPVIDVSAGNDWTLVQVWYPPSGAMGVTRWPAHGFIHPPAAMTEAAIAARMPIVAASL